MNKKYGVLKVLRFKYNIGLNIKSYYAGVLSLLFWSISIIASRRIREIIEKAEIAASADEIPHRRRPLTEVAAEAYEFIPQFTELTVFISFLLSNFFMYLWKMFLLYCFKFNLSILFDMTFFHTPLSIWHICQIIDNIKQIDYCEVSIFVHFAHQTLVYFDSICTN